MLCRLLICLIYTALGLGIAIYLCLTLIGYPLIDWAVDDVDWTREWLYMTVLDYYGAAVCLAIIAVYSENSLCAGLLWATGFCLLGSPVCCLYIVYRAYSENIALWEDGGDYRLVK